MPGHAHRFDVLRLVVEQLAQLHDHQLPSAALSPVKVCPPVFLTGTQATSGGSTTSALPGRSYHPQFGSPLGGLTPLLCRLRLRVRRPSGGCDWPGLLARPSGVRSGFVLWGSRTPQTFPGWLEAQAQPGCFCPQAWGQRRMLFFVGRQPDGRASWENPQL